MLMTPIYPPIPPRAYQVVRLVRRWTASEELGPDRLASLVGLAGHIGISTQAAVALASMFELTEGCLGRKLEAGCCCSTRLARDERAILAMLAVALPDRPHLSQSAMPHGLPGALCWAIASVRVLMEDDVAVPERWQRCPFAR